MKKILLLTAAMLIAAPAFAADESGAVAPPLPEGKFISSEERLKIELVVKDLLNREPGLIMEAAQRFQMQQREKQDQAAKENIGKNKAALVSDKNSPVAGNPKGDVTVVEFFDYNCGYCKKAHPTTEQLRKDDKNVRTVFKQYPILGPTSLTAAQAATAAHLQGKFIEMHDALMENKGAISEDSIAQMASNIKGLDVEKLKKDMKGDEVKKRIDADLALGQKIGISGTPGFIIGETLYPGAMDLDQFKKIVADERAKAPAKK